MDANVPRDIRDLHDQLEAADGDAGCAIKSCD
jgi:hypothetical protein